MSNLERKLRNYLRVDPKTLSIGQTLTGVCDITGVRGTVVTCTAMDLESQDLVEFDVCQTLIKKGA